MNLTKVVNSSTLPHFVSVCLVCIEKDMQGPFSIILSFGTILDFQRQEEPLKNVSVEAG